MVYQVWAKMFYSSNSSLHTLFAVVCLSIFSATRQSSYPLCVVFVYPRCLYFLIELFKCYAAMVRSGAISGWWMDIVEVLCLYLLDSQWIQSVFASESRIRISIWCNQWCVWWLGIVVVSCLYLFDSQWIQYVIRFAHLHFRARG